MIACQIESCPADATGPANIDGTEHHVCELHRAALLCWSILTAPDLDPTPHHERPCALCREGERAPGRAVCWECMAAAYAVHADATNR